jgi:phosphopantetheinyl transferase
LALLPEREQQRVTGKRFLHDRKTQLATSLLQRYYIHATGGEEWEKIHIGRTPYGKPIYGNLHYNNSRAEGVVVLVGYSDPIGVDIIAKDTSQFEASDLKGLFSPRELGVSDGKELAVDDRHLVGWAYKEAYMKFTGIPDWDNITSFEFIGVQPPRPGEVFEKCEAFIEGVKQQCYTELHNFNNTHFIAIYTNTAPEISDDKRFRRLTLQEIILTLKI